MRSVDVMASPDSELLADLFAHRCRPIWELYTDRLNHGEPIKATCSWTRIFADHEMSPDSVPNFGEEPADNFGLFESALAPVDRAILRAPRSEWPLLYLEWLHSVMLHLAAIRGWDPAPLVAARQGCLDIGIDSFYEEWVKVDGPGFEARLLTGLKIPDWAPPPPHPPDYSDVWPPPHIGVIGGGVWGGTVSTIPPEYHHALTTLLNVIDRSKAWQQWWQASGQPPCEIYYWLGGPRTEIKIRRTKVKVTARIERAIPAPRPDEEQEDPGPHAAIADVAELMERLIGRFGLPPHPPLGSLAYLDYTNQEPMELPRADPGSLTPEQLQWVNGLEEK